eukprot:SAG31_NODE_3100_length_4675_cov_3.664117_1_plen_107_part_00
MSAEVVHQPASGSADVPVDFIECSSFSGTRPGYVFATRNGRTGYHLDTAGPRSGAVISVRGTVEGQGEYLDFEVPEGTPAGTTIVLEVRKQKLTGITRTELLNLCV